MNDSQLSRYAALESRLPEGKFPRLKDHGFHFDKGRWWVERFGEETKVSTKPSDLDCLAFAVLVLRAGRNRLFDMNTLTAGLLKLSSAIEDGLCNGNVGPIDRLLTALESAYPATEGGGQ